MTIRPILEAPDPVLKQISRPVAAVTDETRALMDDMLETMYAAPGIGLAAIQIGVPQRILVIDIGDGPALDGGDIAKNPRYFINPEISDTSDDLNIYEEGCLSVPDFYEEVERPARCTVRYLDYQGEAQELKAEGLLATCIQHEMDHLDGILFVDHLSRLKRNMILKKLQKRHLADATA